VNILTELSPTVKHFDDVYAEMVYEEMATAARRVYVEKILIGVPMLPWPEFVAIFGQVYGTHNGVDLSVFPTPTPPHIPDPAFDQWVATMEVEFGDMSDAQIQQRMGVHMF